MLAKGNSAFKLAHGEMEKIQEDEKRCQEHQEDKESVTVTKRQWAWRKAVFLVKGIRDEDYQRRRL